jgi:hypothetical protein
MISSLKNNLCHPYLISELRLVCDQYCNLRDEETMLKAFIESRQKAATAIMQVS